MTEEIIIDGINVAGCRYFRMNNKMPMCRACNSGTGNPYCEYEKSCYYKQLKRLEQENKELKSVLEEIRELLGYGYIVDKINEVLNE